MKLRAKLTLTATLIVVLAVLISTFLVIAFTRQKTIDEITTSAIADYEEFYYGFFIDTGFDEILDESDVTAYSYLRQRFYNEPGRYEFALQKGDTIISNNTGIDAAGALDAKRTASADIDYVADPLRYAIYRIGSRDYFIASAGFGSGTQQGYTLSLVRDVTEKIDDINRLGMKCALAGAGVIITAAVLVLLFVRRSLMPVRALEKGAVEISNGNYERRIQIEGHDEIASLAERFNVMADAVSGKIAALHETAERQQAFIGALSHEMKTPVTSIMARAETLLMRDVSADDMKHSLERMYHQCAWLEKLSGKLTTLVLLQEPISVKPENVHALFDAVAQTVSDALDEKNITLAVDCNMETLSIDFDLMRTALVNLIDNARKASTPGAVIALRAYSGILEVEDHGEGIPKEEIDRITQPFYMVDRSRSRRKGGSGLGLALVERIVQAHGARLHISSTLGEGTTVQIIFADGENEESARKRAAKYANAAARDETDGA